MPVNSKTGHGQLQCKPASGYSTYPLFLLLTVKWEINDVDSYCLGWESREAHSPSSLSKNKATGELCLLISKACLLDLQNMSKIWALLTTTIAVIRVWAAFFSLPEPQNRPGEEKKKRSPLERAAACTKVQGPNKVWLFGKHPGTVKGQTIGLQRKENRMQQRHREKQR